jgi:organic hydroperoxide reductase OsmC/OhrA
MIELVWDLDRRGTAASSSGASVCVGEDAAFTPEDLVAAAAATCVMRTFMQLAAEGSVPVLSYTAVAHVESGRGPIRPHVFVRECVLAPDDAQASRVIRLCEQAARVAPVAQLLGDRLTVQADVRILKPSTRSEGGCP